MWRADILARTENQFLLSRARNFSASIFRSGVDTDRDGVFGSIVWAELHSSGLAMSPFPEELGGSGLSDSTRQLELCAILRLLGGADLSMARIFEGHVNAIALVARYGDILQLRRLSKRVKNGGLAAVWGADDATGLHIVLDKKPVLQGRKILASGAGIVTDPIVTARADAGQVMCLLQLGMNERVDLSGWNASGMRSTATGAIDLSGLELSPANMLGVPGDFVRQPYFSGGAWRFCATHVGATERLVDLFRDHLVSRGRGDDPYQLQRLARCVAAAKTARHWVEEAARRLSTKEPDIVAFANLTRMVTERCALDVIETVQRGVGLTSFIRPNPIERIARDLATYLRQPVPDLAMSDGAKAFLDSSLSVADF